MLSVPQRAIARFRLNSGVTSRPLARRSRKRLQAIVNVSNKAELKQQIIRAQAKKDLDVYLEQQELVKARQAAEAFQVTTVHSIQSVAHGVL